MSDRKRSSRSRSPAPRSGAKKQSRSRSRSRSKSPTNRPLRIVVSPPVAAPVAARSAATAAAAAASAALAVGMPIDAAKDERACAICLEPCKMADCDINVQYACGHISHKACLWPWLSKNSSCPECRALCLLPSTWTELMYDCLVRQGQPIRPDTEVCLHSLLDYGQQQRWNLEPKGDGGANFLYLATYSGASWPLIKRFLDGGLHPDQSANHGDWDKRTAREALEKRFKVEFADYESKNKAKMDEALNATKKQEVTWDDLCNMVSKQDVKALALLFEPEGRRAPIHHVQIDDSSIHSLAMRTKNSEVIHLIFSHYPPFGILGSSSRERVSAMTGVWVQKARDLACDESALEAIRTAMARYIGVMF